jgi:hypothetical protein
VVLEPRLSRPPALPWIYGTAALQREVSPDSKPSLKGASPPRVVKGCGLVGPFGYGQNALPGRSVDPFGSTTA